MNKIIFFGELAPRIVHGVSLANKLNIDLLANKLSVHIVEEETDLVYHNKICIKKITNIFRYTKKIYNLNKKNYYNYLYTIFSLSTFGSIKTLCIILGYILSGKGKVILHIHRGDFLFFYNKNILNKFFTKVIFYFTFKLIVLSKKQKIEFSNYFDITKIFVLENSLINEYVCNNTNNGLHNFLFISNYIKEKGIYELFEAFKNSDDKYLECFGEFVNNENEIMKYQNNNIRIHGFLSGKSKFDTINKANALILPSWNEGQPTIILEAMMMGTIILTTKVGLICELLGDDYPFYFEMKNIESLKECIEKFILYENKHTLSNTLKDIYFNKYSKSIHEKKLMKIWEENIA